MMIGDSAGKLHNAGYPPRLCLLEIDVCKKWAVGRKLTPGHNLATPTGPTSGEPVRAGHEKKGYGPTQKEKFLTEEQVSGMSLKSDSVLSTMLALG